MNNYTGYKPISTSLKCVVCGKDLLTCPCTKVSLTANASYMSSVNGGGHFSISGGSAGVGGGGPFFANCNVCGGPVGACSCFTSVPFPSITIPSIMPGGGTWSGTSIFTGIETHHAFVKVLDVESKDRYEHSGFFKIEQKNETDGIYGSLSGLILPIEFKEVFAQLRKEDRNKLVQIRSPLTFQVDFQLDANTEESHYFTLTTVKDVEVGEAKILLTDPKFQEVVNPIDLCQLIEIQRVFTKLLRRI